MTTVEQVREHWIQFAVSLTLAERLWLMHNPKICEICGHRVIFHSSVCRRTSSAACKVCWSIREK